MNASELRELSYEELAEKLEEAKGRPREPLPPLALDPARRRFRLARRGVRSSLTRFMKQGLRHIEWRHRRSA